MSASHKAATIPAESPTVESHPTVERTIRASVQVALPFLIHEEADGGYSVEVPALPGCITEGETLEEALANVREAAEGWLEAKHDIETKGFPGGR